MICNFLKEVKLSGLFFVCLVLQRSRVAADVPPTGFANLRVINAGVCKINAFGVGLNAEVPLMQVWKSINYVGVKNFFLSFFVNVIFQTAVFFSSSPIVYSLLSHAECAVRLAVRVPVRSFVRQFFL